MPLTRYSEPEDANLDCNGRDNCDEFATTVCRLVVWLTLPYAEEDNEPRPRNSSGSSRSPDLSGKVSEPACRCLVVAVISRPLKASNKRRSSASTS